MKPHNYQIYPSLLDAFERYLTSEEAAEDFSNIDERDNYRKTADEIADEREAALIAMINRVSKEPIMAADKGTCFNEVIDCIMLNRKSSREDVQIHSVKDVNGNTTAIQAEMDGFTFLYEPQLCRELAEYFGSAGSVPQCRVEADLMTSKGNVHLYGYADYVGTNKVYDLKTTSRYQFPKYDGGFQKDVYPYCLEQSGAMLIQSFEYTIVQWKRTPLLSGSVYKEEYTYDKAKSTARLRRQCELLIDWLESHREQITDTKIFGE